ncbi:MAG TPA: DUF4097 family beta strand repeat-containing protein [Gemmatimonadaceae bacterium]|nr:DUF4097 family beta strand repeat-containing protein [Gemmatimonadaceae bacterium]
MTGAACSRPHTDDAAFDWSQQLPAGSIVHLRDGTGNIDVRQSGNASGHVHATTHWRRGRASDIHFVVSTAGPNEYYICAMWRGSGQCGESGYHGASRTGSFLQIFSLFHHGTDAGANFVAELPASVVIDATTTNGSVTIDGSAAGVRARATNGTIDARHVSGPISIHTTNGEIHLAADSLGSADSVDVSTVNGMIQAELPAQTDGAWDLRVTNGVVHSDFALPSTSGRRGNRHLTGQIGSSTRSIRMRAVNGMVTVTHPTQAAAPAAPAAPVPPTPGKNP